MITILHRGGVGPNDYRLHRGGGVCRDPQKWLRNIWMTPNRQSCSQGWWWWWWPAAGDPPRSSWELMNYIWIVSVVLNATFLSHTTSYQTIFLARFIFCHSTILSHCMVPYTTLLSCSKFFYCTTILVVVSHNVQPSIPSGRLRYAQLPTGMWLLFARLSRWLIKCDHYLLGRWLIRWK